jgi:hypothetical protein
MNFCMLSDDISRENSLTIEKAQMSDYGLICVAEVGIQPGIF